MPASAGVTVRLRLQQMRLSLAEAGRASVHALGQALNACLAISTSIFVID
jgi:hypothetical protein